MLAASKTASVSGGYQISRSLRFNSADSAYLNRTPAGAGNRTTWTWSGWIKFSKITGVQFIFGASSDNYANNFTLLQMDNAASTLTFYDYTSAYNFQLTPSMVFRDPSAWYHIVWAYDSNAATSSDRVKIYVNGNQVTAFSTASYPTSARATVLNSAVVHNYGTSSYPISGYLTETNFIDGQALTPSSFGETNVQTGVWQPKAYSGSYGTNGFYLNFSDNSNTTAATLGKDYSGNGNNWTPNNFSVTAGAGNDSLVDSPTSYGTDTGVGGTVRGNYATLNPLNNVATLANGNLDISSASVAWLGSSGTILPNAGKWYWEMTVTSLTNYVFTGIASPTFAQASGSYTGVSSNSYSYASNDGRKWNNGSSSAYGATFTTNDVIGVALDMDAGTLTFYKNGTSQGTAFTGLTGTYGPSLSVYQAGCSMNFGQRPFAYTAPSGFKALCTQNLPTPTIGATSTTLATQYFNPALYTGTNATQSVTTGFQPDLVWIKSRSAVSRNTLFDAVRGVTKVLWSDSTDAEGTANAGTGLTSLNSTGFTLGTEIAGTSGSTNVSGVTYASWNWKANGSGSTNTAGSITSTVSANTTSGFSVVTYTGNGTNNSTIGHGLGVTPSMIIVKNRSSSCDWVVYHISLGGTVNLYLNGTFAASSPGNGGIYSPSSTIFTTNNSGTAVQSNQSGQTYVAYCFAPIAGYSAFGSYTGNGSTDGPFVYCGFRPAWIMLKRIDATGEDWFIYDATRNTSNANNLRLEPNLSDAEVTTSNVNDFLSNGFKIRNVATSQNSSGINYIFAAFATAPFKYSLAR